MAYRERLTKTRVQDFSALDGMTQQAFVDAVIGGGGTPVVLSNRAMPLGSSVQWLALALGGSLLIALAALPGWSLLESRPLIDAWLLPFALGGAAIALGAVGLVRRRFAQRGLPYPPGVYVLPTQLVDARGPRLRLRQLTELLWVSHEQNKTFLSLRVRFEVELHVPGVEQGASGKTQFEADRLWYRRHSGRTPYSQMFENAGSALEHEVERLIRE